MILLNLIILMMLYLLKTKPSISALKNTPCLQTNVYYVFCITVFHYMPCFSIKIHEHLCVRSCVSFILCKVLQSLYQNKRIYSYMCLSYSKTVVILRLIHENHINQHYKPLSIDGVVVRYDFLGGILIIFYTGIALHGMTE